MKKSYFAIMWNMTIKQYFKSNETLLELIKVEKNTSVGGILLTVREISVDKRILLIPIFSQKIKYYWNPLKQHILREYVTAKEWGVQDDNYTSMWLRVQNPIVDIEFYPENVRFHKNFKCSEELTKTLNKLSQHGK